MKQSIWSSISILSVSFLVTAAMLAGCTGSQRAVALQGSSVAGQLTVADRLLQSGTVEQTVLSVSVTESELASLTEAFNQYELAREIIGGIIDDPTRAADAGAIIRSEHARLARAYQSVQDVVIDNWERYDMVAQARLDRWRGQVHRLEDSYQRLAQAVAEARTESARTQRIGELARVAGQIALMAV